MNREHKHQLERNELADRLGAGLSSIQSILPLVAGGLAILIVGSAIWGLYSSSQQKKQSAAWTEYYFNMSDGSPEDFLDLANSYPDSKMAGWARVSAGDGYLASGIESLYSNRSLAKEQLDLAIETYEQALADAENDELKSKALLGLAQAHESAGDLEQAAEYFEQFSTTSNQPNLVRSARERLSFINSEAGKEFYAWFGKLDPKPEAPIDMPDNLNMPPLGPDLDFDPLSTTNFSTGGDSDLSGPPGTVAPETQPIDPSVLPPIDAQADSPQEGGDAADTSSETPGNEASPADGSEQQ